MKMSWRQKSGKMGVCITIIDGSSSSIKAAGRRWPAVDMFWQNRKIKLSVIITVPQPNQNLHLFIIVPYFCLSCLGTTMFFHNKFCGKLRLPITWLLYAWINFCMHLLCYCCCCCSRYLWWSTGSHQHSVACVVSSVSHDDSLRFPSRLRDSQNAQNT